ncbi:MAG: type II toxin-antitoxin system RelE/ParE family toxin [Treponematales bacterium]
MEIRKTSVFRKWMKALRDIRAKAHIDRRVDRLSRGNPGDVRPIGEGCSEMRIDYGPGYRVYYKDTGKAVVIILCGGDKSTQRNDIARALRIAREEEEDENE